MAGMFMFIEALDMLFKLSGRWTNHFIANIEQA